MNDQLSEGTRAKSLDSQSKPVSEAVVKELQAFADEVMSSGPPWSNYLRARSMGLISSQFAILDKALAMGIIKIKESA